MDEMRRRLPVLMSVLAILSAIWLWIVPWMGETNLPKPSSPPVTPDILPTPSDHAEIRPTPSEHASPKPPLSHDSQANKDKTSSRDEPIRANRQPLTVLIMGVDQRPGDRGRPDALLVARLDPGKKKVTLLSIPRDTYVPIADTKRWDKINHAYLWGISAIVKTVENFFGISIDHYVWLNMEGFVKLVDALGGVCVNVEKQMISHVKPYVRLKAGSQILNGKEALAYVRFRSDAENDYGRQRRQREVIQAMLSRLEQRDIRQVPQIIAGIRALGPNLKTDLTILEIIRLAADFHSLRGKDVNTLEIKSRPSKVKGKWVVLVEKTERDRIASALSRPEKKIQSKKID